MARATVCADYEMNTLSLTTISKSHDKIKKEVARRDATSKAKTAQELQ
jgi:hypothetical protein